MKQNRLKIEYICMKYFLLFLLLISFSNSSFSKDLTGTWKGVLINNGNAASKGTLFYLDINQNDGYIGFSREEIRNSSNYAVKKIKGSVSDSTITFNQVAITSKNSGRKKWCLMNFKLHYNTLTGYMEGTYSSKECRRNQGKIILYKVNYEFQQKEISNIDQSWIQELLYDLKEGLSAPEIRIKERESFVFEPVYFDFDKDEIRPESEAFLLSLIKVVKGHTDLRVKITGHTDSDGTNNYNDGLSRRRAQSIIDFFVKNGLSEDRLEFDFHGEKKPVDTNSTSKGKQNNRRVDFEFI